MGCGAISESAWRLTTAIIGSACAAKRKTDFVWRNDAFRKGSLKSLISLMEPNQPFRGILSFQ
jgi:hypothetical protein